MLTCLQKIYPVTPDLFERISACCIQKEFARGDLLVTAGSSCPNLYLVLNGFCFSYFEKDGREQVMHFFGEGECCTPFSCFRGRKKSLLNVMANEDTTVLCISRENYDSLLQQSMEFLFFVNTIIEKAAIKYEEVYYQRRSKSALERVRNCRDTHEFQSLIKKVPQYRIASYLQMTPENFAKMQRNLNGKE